MELQKMNGHSRDDGFDGLDAMAEQEEFLPPKPGVKKEMHFTDFEGKTSFGMSIFNLSNAIMGTMSSYLFIVKSELPLVIQAFLGKEYNTGEWFLNGNYLIIIVSAFIILPLALMKRLGYLGYTSGFSLSCMVFFLISVIYKRFNIQCPLPGHNISLSHDSMNGTDDFCEAKLITVNSQTAYTIPILAFAFVCHPEVLPIYTELRDANKKRMQRVANISILAMFVMYLLTALFGYLTFYGAVESELLHTYNQVDPLDVLILCVRLAVLVAVTLTVPVVLFPIRRALLQIFFPEKPFSWYIHCGIAFCLIFLVNLLVIFVPSIRDIFGLIGATSAPSLIFILPGIFYVRIVPKDQEPFLSRPKIQAACFAALGFIFMIMSLSFIIIDWVTGESRSGGGH
ncbi:Sodium-coupled neutral amino acid transporter 3 [Nibea albiflora]|uniref:Sodium-coupled neutral amino acid transporter 3 n=1 Tax=Nibea albiflora TaxID=240163 RepID=A0ACB7EKP4_NIBAL|nr:Sodium-coupled neutral amino acid transporter 3 [Nibea albiflora]